MFKIIKLHIKTFQLQRNKYVLRLYKYKKSRVELSTDFSLVFNSPLESGSISIVKLFSCH